MPDRRRALGIFGVGVAAAISGAILSSRPAWDSGAAGVLYGANVTDIAGNRRSLSEWQGQFLVVNFWATWCQPCREEIPGFMRAREKFLRTGVEFVGIAIDKAAKVADFAEDLRITYPLLLAEAGATDLLRKLGNPSGGLPFTVLVDRAGGIVSRHLGALSAFKIDSLLQGATSK